MSTKGQGHWLTLVQISQIQYFLNFFKARFHVEPPWDGETKACSNDPGHMTNMATMPIMVKTFKNLLWNRKADDLEILYAALSTTKFIQMMPLGCLWPIL